MKIKSIAFCLAGFGVLAGTAGAAVSLATGDMAVAFYQVTGSTLGPNTYMFDLGTASFWRENTQVGLVSDIRPSISSSNISADLVTAFGSNWADSGTVRWMVIGNLNSVQPVTNGDSPITNYMSRPTTSVDGSSIGNLSAGNRALLSGSLNPSIINRVNETSGANPDGTIVPTSKAFTIDEFLPPTKSPATYFGLGSAFNQTQTLNSGTIGSTGYEGLLDVYRIINSTVAGVDLTAGHSTGNAVVGAGQYIGSFALDSAGNLSVIPEPSGAIALGLIGTIAGLGYRRRRNG